LCLFRFFSAFSLIPFDFFGFIDLSHTLPIYPQRPPPEPPPKTPIKISQVLCTCGRTWVVDYSTTHWLIKKRSTVLDSPESGLSSTYLIERFEHRVHARSSSLSGMSRSGVRTCATSFSVTTHAIPSVKQRACSPRQALSCAYLAEPIPLLLP
jgi:hypothetical protein